MQVAAVHESPLGTKPTCRACGGMSPIEGHADVGWAYSDVAFNPKRTFGRRERANHLPFLLADLQ